MKNNRYVFFFQYERDWMIVCYDSEDDYQYFNSAEDDLDVALNYIDLFLENEGNKYHYILPDYDYVSEIDIFDLKNEPIKQLEEYLEKKYE